MSRVTQKRMNMTKTECHPGAGLVVPSPSLTGGLPVAVRASGQGGDLMSDLFNKLVMRRKGEGGPAPQV